MRPRAPLSFALTAAFMTLMPGCCGRLNPTTDQVQLWVNQELPPGTSEADVKDFSARHQFQYERDTPAYAQAYRRVEGCDWKKPVVQVEVTYDENNQVKSTNVRSFSVGLP
jgi:hypothetical protein